MCWAGLCQVRNLFSLSDWWHFSVIIKFISLAILSTLVWWALNLVLESWIWEVLPFCLFIAIVWPLKKIKNLSSFNPMLSFRINSAVVHSNIRNTLRSFLDFFSAFFFSDFKLRKWSLAVLRDWGLGSGYTRKAEGVSMRFFCPSHFQNLFISISPSLSLILSGQ